VDAGTEEEEEVDDPTDSNDRAWGTPFTQETSEMETCMVYLLNKQRASKTPVGTLMERRGAERGNNIAGLLKLAAIRFNVVLGQTIQINFRGICAEMEIRAVKGSRPK
jgi:hypothetical protein